MKIVLQRVKNAKLKINNKLISEIKQGIVAYVGFGKNDDENCLNYMANKITGIRIFNDNSDKINLPNLGEFLIIPNFTLYANTTHGFRPSFTNCLEPEKAKLLFKLFVDKLKELLPNRVKAGIFGENMLINQTNDGPITIILEN